MKQSNARVSSRSAADSQARGAATEKALSPIFQLVLGATKSQLLKQFKILFIPIISLTLQILFFVQQEVEI